MFVNLCDDPHFVFSIEYIVEGHRFNIYEEIGCYPATYNVTLAYPLSIVWPLVIGLASVIYCSMGFIYYPSSVSDESS